MATSHGIDDYLETIYFLAFPIGEYQPSPGTSQAIAARVGEMLGVSRASAGEMLKRLEAEGLVERGEHKEAILTERLLTDFMGYTAGEAHVHADVLGGTFTDEMIERIDEKLGHPLRCPHGWPVDPDFEQAENRELQPLSDLEPGQLATIVRLAEHDGDLLHWFYAEGLVPGTEVQLRAAEPAAGQFRVTMGGGEKAIGEKAAAGLFVKKT
jgi:DtxR family Mn-dependent transcriptional regulator